MKYENEIEFNNNFEIEFNFEFIYYLIFINNSIMDILFKLKKNEKYY